MLHEILRRLRADGRPVFRIKLRVFRSFCLETGPYEEQVRRRDLFLVRNQIRRRNFLPGPFRNVEEQRFFIDKCVYRKCMYPRPSVIEVLRRVHMRPEMIEKMQDKSVG